MDPDEVAAIADWPAPTNVMETHSFQGFANFYCHFICKYLHKVLPLTALMKTALAFPFVWSEEAQASFDTIKDAFVLGDIL